MDNRNSPPVKTRDRSGIDGPSVAADGYTVFESMSITVGESGAPASADQPKLLTNAVQEPSARGVIRRGLRKRGRVCCYPGKGTPGVPRTAAPETAVRDTLVCLSKVINLVTRVKRDRVPSVQRLSSIVEKQCESTPDEEVGTVNASGSNPIVFDADKVSPTGNTSPSTGRSWFSNTACIRDTICAHSLSTPRGIDEPAPEFPRASARLGRRELSDVLSEFTRAVGGEVTLNRKHHTAGVHLFAGSKALRTIACQALFDTGSPASFIQEKIWLRMVAGGAASDDGLKAFGQTTRGGFHGAPLISCSQVRLNVRLGNGGRLGRSSTVCLVVHAHIVPDSAMSTALP